MRDEGRENGKTEAPETTPKNPAKLGVSWAM
jgi:hypothetical protein